MFTGKLENHLNDKWIKKLIKTYDPGPLAELIAERIKFPTNTGPFIQYNSTEEKPVDIITALISTAPDFRKKIEPAVGLLLWKMINGHMEERQDLICGAFALIRDNTLIDCTLLLREWLKKNKAYLKADTKQNIELYNYALFTLCTIQQKDKELEEFWFDLWRNGKAQFWTAAFYGMRKQSPKMAVDELPLLIERNTSRMTDHLSCMMSDEECWPLLKQELQDGLKKENEYCGLALNALLAKITDKQEREKLIGDLHNTMNANYTTN